MVQGNGTVTGSQTTKVTQSRERKELQRAMEQKNVTSEEAINR
jgi:hypothetical protein